MTVDLPAASAIDKEELERYVAPCSLLCCTCGGFKEGIIAESARLLRHYLSSSEGFGLPCQHEQLKERGKHNHDSQ